MSPTCDETSLITTDPGPVETEERRKGMFAPLFRFRRSTATTLTRATNKREQKKHPDESSTVDETDDEFSSSSSFDLIDSILGSAVESPITDNALLTTPPTSTPTATPDAFAANTNLNTATYETVPDNTLHSCLKLLSSKDLDLNRVGLQRLVMLTKGRTLSGLYHSEEVASHVLVFGGPLGSVEERLRFIFATMICDAPHDDHEDEDEYYLNLNSNLNLTTPAFSDEEDALFDWILDYDPTKSGVENNNNTTDNPNNNNDDADDESSYCSSYSEDEYEYESSHHPQGKANGVLHNHALRILANALCKVASSSSSSSTEQQQHQQLSGIMTKIPIIPLHGTLWKNITRSLVDNIETNRNADSTGYSLKILRLLHAIHPEMIVPVLRTVLFPHLVHLAEYGANHQFPIIYSEASYLYKIATSEPKHKQLTTVTN